MPRSCNRRRVRFVWLLRAWALRRCARVILAAACASSLSTAWASDSHQERTKAATAVCSWQTVRSGFFPPPLLPHPRQEQQAHRREEQVAFQPHMAPALVVLQADLAFVILEAPFHP